MIVNLRRVYLVAITDELGGHSGMRNIVGMVEAKPLVVNSM